MTNPYITIYGNTFDYDPLLKHVTSCNQDPLTGQKLLKSDLIPNVNMKHAVEDFLEQNPWAFEFKQEENLENFEIK
jgi:STIP1 family protein 1